MHSFTYDPVRQRVVFGHGTINDIVSEVERLATDHGAVRAGVTRPASGQGGGEQRRVFVITTKGGTALGERVQALLGSLCVGICHGAEMHTPVPATERALASLTACGADTLVAIGGGSAIGLSKALALRTGLPQIVLPTTYSGSEATSTVGQTEDGKKTTSKDPTVMAKTVIYDVDLTMTLEMQITKTSGMNAIAHAVEALYASNGNPVTDQLAVQGIRTMTEALTGLTDPNRREVHREKLRSDALYAAWLCGSCLANVNMGLHHKLAHTLGGLLGTPHSETHTILLPYTLLYNFEACSQTAQQNLVEALIEDFDWDDEIDGTLGEAVIGELCDFIHIIKGSPPIATSLRQLGVKKDDLDAIVDAAMSSATYPNPAPLERTRLSMILEMAWAGKRPVN